MNEATFKRSLMKKLRSIPRSWFFSKEALAIRGIPDIIGIVDGTFVALEVKRSEGEASKVIGTIALQRFTINKVTELGGFASFVYPENVEYVLDSIMEFCFSNVSLMKH